MLNIIQDVNITSDTIVQILSYVAAIITAIGGTWVANSIRNKNRADAAKSITDAAVDLVEARDKEVEDLKEKNKQTNSLDIECAFKEVYIQYLLAGIKVLQLQIPKDTAPAFNPIPQDKFRN